MLIGIEHYDAEDLNLASSEDFCRMIHERRASGKSFSLAEVEARLRIEGGKPAGKATRSSKSRKHS